MELLVLSLSLHMQQLHLPPMYLKIFKDVHYTVKAQDGTTTDWTVKWTYGGKVNDGEGFEYFFKNGKLVYLLHPIKTKMVSVQCLVII